MRGCPICSRINETGYTCPECGRRLRLADDLAGVRFVGITLTQFWVLIALLALLFGVLVVL